VTTDDVYFLIKYCVGKNIQQGYVSPEEFNRIINVAQRSYVDFLLGEYQRYQIQRPIAVVEFGQNERIRQSLAPLIYGTVLSPNSVTGIAPFPSDHEYPDAMWGLYGFYNIRFIQQDRLDSYYHSSIDPIATNPVYLIRHEGFQFYPETIGFARLSYVRTPPSIVWAYVLDGNGLPVYDPFNSQQPVWGDSDILQIIVRALRIVGVSLDFNTVSQYSNEIKNIGQ
jgi:hypothetical protein